MDHMTILVNLTFGMQGVSMSGTACEAGLSAKAERVMRALGRGAVVRREGADWILEGSDVTVAMATLVARDLVRRDADGIGRLSAPGAAWLRRRAAADEAGRALVAGDPEMAAVAAPYRAQHQALAVRQAVADRTGVDGAGLDGGTGARQWVNLGESPLGWLRRRRDKAGVPLISAAQFAAGERLRSEFERAGIPPPVTSVWSGLSAEAGGGGYREFSPTERQMRSRQRFERAMAAMGPGLAEVVVRVCCYQEGLNAIEGDRGWPARSAKVVLGLGLDRLRTFYGIG